MMTNKNCDDSNRRAWTSHSQTQVKIPHPLFLKYPTNCTPACFLVSVLTITLKLVVLRVKLNFKLPWISDLWLLLFFFVSVNFVVTLTLKLAVISGNFALSYLGILICSNQDVIQFVPGSSLLELKCLSTLQISH